MNRFFTLLLAASCLTAVGQDFDGLTQAFTTDSSIFLTSEGQLSWDSAQAFAASIGGHLATFADTTENLAVVQWMTQNSGYWFGLRQDVNGVEPDEGWGWITGESLDFTYWNGPEPNNIGNEDCGELTGDGKWNDNPCAELRYFVVEVALHAGCTDQMACNYDPEANVDDGSCELSGCLDEDACNFDAEADCDDGSCDYSCCPGPGCCDVGTEWSWESNTCIVTNPADINLDGCVQLNDLLDLLSAYGDCGAEESPWQCGDPLEYQGYDYATVLIGDQCWFAENLRSENYENGDTIPSGLTDSEWENTSSGAVAVHGEGSSTCTNYSPDGDACDEAWSLTEYGRLYNWFAVDDPRRLCPSGWHVPTDEEWTVLTDHLGGWSVAGGQMKTEYGWNNGGNGTNSSGFSGLPGGYRSWSGFIGSAGYDGGWWSSPPFSYGAWHRGLSADFDYVARVDYGARMGFSVRCVRDAE